MEKYLIRGNWPKRVYLLTILISKLVHLTIVFNVQFKVFHPNSSTRRESSVSNVLVVDPKNPSVSAISRALKIIRTGGLIVYPTDTVYGLGANALNVQAVLRVFEVKRRPLDQPLPVAVSGSRMSEELAYLNEKARRLMEVFWPGALTIVLERKTKIPSVVTGGKAGVGLRAPDNEVPLSIMRLSNLPLITTSANKHGAPPCVDARGVVGQLDGEVDLIIDGGRGRTEASTIIDLLREPPVILRRGPVSRESIEGVIGFVEET